MFVLSLFHANYKVKYNHCDDFNRCLDGALISSEVNTLAQVRIPAKSSTGVPLSFFIGQHGKNMRSNSVVFYRPSGKQINNFEIRVNSADTVLNFTH